jgi:outer membrane autotransporter protein
VVTKTVAAISGHAITSAIDTALGDAFNNAGNPITPSPNGFAVNFAAEPRSAIQKRTDDAFAALGYAGMPAKAPPRLRDKDWSVWADVRGSGFDHDDAANTHGRQVNITGGVGRKLSRDLVVGLFGGYENFNYTMDVIVGRMTGSGGTIGAYAGWRLTEHWRLDGKIGWSDVGYDGTAGTASGSFRGSRWLAAGGFTGQYGFAAFFVEPSARIYALWESENAYTDSLGAVHPSRQFSEGNVSAGAKLIYPMWLGSGRSLSPYLGLYTDYRFSTDNALPVAFADAGIKDGWSERVSAGLALACGNGATFAVGGELAGLGAGYQIWSATARVNWRF